MERKGVGKGTTHESGKRQEGIRGVCVCDPCDNKKIRSREHLESSLHRRALIHSVSHWTDTLFAQSCSRF